MRTKRILMLGMVALILLLQGSCTKQWISNAISDGIVDGMRKVKKERAAKEALKQEKSKDANPPEHKDEQAETGHKEEHHDVHWGYEGATGPDHWGEFFPECRNGRSQAPLDIKGPFNKRVEPLVVNYKESVLTMLNNGHTIQVNYDPGSSITINHETYYLVQFHFHRPSEEKINGKTKAMVAHFVHKSLSGKLAVIGVLLDEGKENDLIKILWDFLPKEEGHEEVVEFVHINASKLLPHEKGYYHYMGSLTTPPCTEGIAFYIMKETVPVSKAQVAAFPFKKNARPTQSLNGRTIYESAL